MKPPTLEQWQAAWPGCRPIGHELRIAAAERWVRFHSLPQSQRYAGDEGEYAIVLQRHLAVLDHLTSSATARVFVVVQSWSADGDSQPSSSVAAVTQWRKWGTLPTDPDDPDTWVTGLHLTELSIADPALMVLLLLVADDEARVVLFDATMRWLYAPYDGGADLIADGEVIARLREKHPDWLSTRADGL